MAAGGARRSPGRAGSGAGPTRADGPPPRTRSARERVLDVVVELLERGGEAAVRVDTVRDSSGVSIGSIYHHFHDRDGLIVAGQVRRFARFAEAEIAALSEIVQRAADREAFRRAIRSMTLLASSELRVAERWARVAVLGSTVGRPALEEEIRRLQTRLTDEFQAHVAQGQARGFFRSDLDARAVALFVEAYSLGRALDDLDDRAVTDEKWEQVVWAALEGLLVTD